MVIPEKSPIIIEIKNITKYNTIIDNIKSKKKLLDSLGLKNFYYIRIIRGIDINKNEKEEINLKKNFDFSKTIIIYPDNLNFLNVQIHKLEKGVGEIKKEDKEEPSLLNKMKELIQTQFREMEDKFNQKFDNLTKEVIGVKSELANVQSQLTDVKSLLTDVKSQLTDVKRQFKN